MSLLSKVSQSQKPRYFRKLWMHAIEWTLVVEFVEGFYTFSLWLELLLVPFYFLFGAVYVFSKYQKNGVPVRKLAGVVLNGIAVAVFMISFYQTIVHWREAFDEEHIKDIFLAPVMTLLYTPFLYLTALFFLMDTSNYSFNCDSACRKIRRILLLLKGRFSTFATLILSA